MSKENNKEGIVKFYIEKSIAIFNDAKFLADDSRWAFCLSRLYYACFYIVYALIVQKIDIRTKTHTGLKTLFNKHISKQGLVSAETAYFYSLIL